MQSYIYFLLPSMIPVPLCCAIPFCGHSVNNSRDHLSPLSAIPVPYPCCHTLNTMSDHLSSLCAVLSPSAAIPLLSKETISHSSVLSPCIPVLPHRSRGTTISHPSVLCYPPLCYPPLCYPPLCYPPLCCASLKYA